MVERLKKGYQAVMERLMVVRPGQEGKGVYKNFRVNAHEKHPHPTRQPRTYPKIIAGEFAQALRACANPH